MRLPRVRFTVRRMMGVVAVLALMLAVLSFLNDLAVGKVGGEPKFGMVLLNVLVSVVVGLQVAIIGADFPDHDEATNDSDELYRRRSSTSYSAV